ncbi:MAG: hypothetical protein ABW116_14960 [Candidatus Sedimenticola sp. 20ELBAFRAG]
MSKPLTFDIFTELNQKIGPDTPEENITITEINKGSEKFTYKYLKKLFAGKSKIVIVTVK